MNNLHIHEVHKVVNDLTDNRSYQLAFDICEQYLDRFDDGYLRFCHLTLPSKMGNLEKTLELLTSSIEKDQWISTWMIDQFKLFSEFKADPRYQEIVNQLEHCEKRYWESDHPDPITKRPVQSAEMPYPLLIGLHGNGLNAEHSAEHWAPAENLGWLSTHPNANNIIGYKQHSWNDINESRRLVKKQFVAVQKQHQIDSHKIILGGFSSGGQVALHMALEGEIGANGFILVGAGGQYFNKPEAYWRPLMQSAPKGLRGVMLYTAYDLERSGADVERLLTLFEAHKIEVKFAKLDIPGHGFPNNFTDKFEKAIRFIYPLT